jgi:hypothetical protein
LAEWGRFPPDCHRRLVSRILAETGAVSARSPSRQPKEAVAEAMANLVSQWAAGLAIDGPVTQDALRAAFLAVEGADRWPGQFLEAPMDPAFREALRRALPQSLPPAAPLDMPEQPL